MSNLKNQRKTMANKNDEYYTPPILVAPIIKYVPKDKIVWCPFDTEQSEFVRQLREAGVRVAHSHIWDWQDFFSYEPDEWDVVVSNPPFSRKLEVLERLYSFDKPFALLLPLPILNYQEIGYYFYTKRSDLQLLIVDKKVSFNGKTSSFNNSYFCRNFLPKDIIFEHLENNNCNADFVGSQMGVRK